MQHGSVGHFKTTVPNSMDPRKNNRGAIRGTAANRYSFFCLETKTAASTIVLESVSEVKCAAVMTDKTQQKTGNDLESDSAKMNQNYQARFNLKFENGSRQNLAFVKFGVQIKVLSFPTFFTMDRSFVAPF